MRGSLLLATVFCARRSGCLKGCAKDFSCLAHPSRPANRLTPMTVFASPPDEFTALLTRLRPRLHRYCARMAGSALDGEDIVQDALTKAALRYDAAVVRQAEAWLFRVAHNAALDFLRRRAL